MCFYLGNVAKLLESAIIKKYRSEWLYLKLDLTHLSCSGNVAQSVVVFEAVVTLYNLDSILMDMVALY